MLPRFMFLNLMRELFMLLIYVNKLIKRFLFGGNLDQLPSCKCKTLLCQSNLRLPMTYKQLKLLCQTYLGFIFENLLMCLYCFVGILQYHPGSRRNKQSNGIYMFFLTLCYSAISLKHNLKLVI